MLHRIVTCALLAGLATGVLLSVLHAALTVPLILQAEVYESKARAVPAALDANDHRRTTADTRRQGNVDVQAEGSTSQGWPRLLLTFLSTIVSATGFALIIAAATVMVYGEINLWTGLGFGLAGFAATGLATSLGLAPKLPGSAAADLVLRQVWWVGTAAATAAGLAAIFFARRTLSKFLGLALIAVPHILGAPGGETPASPVPAELSALFAARSLVLQGVMWAVLGLTCGWIWQRQARKADAPVPA